MKTQIFVFYFLFFLILQKNVFFDFCPRALRISPDGVRISPDGVRIVSVCLRLSPFVSVWGPPGKLKVSVWAGTYNLLCFHEGL